MFDMHTRLWAQLKRRPIPDGSTVVRELVSAVSARERRAILSSPPTLIVDRLIWAARDSGFPLKHLMQEIRGAGTAMNVLFDDSLGIKAVPA
ncbi:MAG: hypothetical protein JWM46_568 [Candidatus Kaiserbacteria bacterium]|nr:hypothetical protein [Candidatus Kaiserbacteria bacterium]